MRSEIAALRSTLNAISVTHLFEQNEYQTDQAMLDLLEARLNQNDAFDPSGHIEQLRNIAIQCPTTGGSSVYAARALLMGLTGEEYDDENCVAMRSGERASYTVQSVINPNPANATVRLHLPVDTQGNLFIFDALGHLYFTSHTRTQVIDVQSWPDGIYFVQWSETTGQTTTQKLVIQH